MPSHKTDIEYIDLVLNGDTDAFRHLVDRYRGMVFSIALRIISNREEAEDAAQEVFVKCYRALKTYNKQAQFSTWLYRIAYNHAIDQLKKMKNKKPALALDTLMIQPADEDANAGQNMDQQKIQSLLRDAIELLPPEDQIIVLLYYYQDQSLKEIGKVVGLKENNIKIRLHRIRQKLASVLPSGKELISYIIS